MISLEMKEIVKLLVDIFHIEVVKEYCSFIPADEEKIVLEKLQKLCSGFKDDCDGWVKCLLMINIGYIFEDYIKEKKIKEVIDYLDPPPTDKPSDGKPVS